MDRQRYAVDSADKYKVYLEQLGSRIDFYEVEPERRLGAQRGWR